MEALDAAKAPPLSPTGSAGSHRDCTPAVPHHVTTDGHDPCRSTHHYIRGIPPDGTLAVSAETLGVDRSRE